LAIVKGGCQARTPAQDPAGGCGDGQSAREHLAAARPARGGTLTDGEDASRLVATPGGT